LAALPAGSLCIGALADLFGRSRALLLTYALLALGGALAAAADGPAALLAARALLAAACGAASVAASLALAELAPATARGALAAAPRAAAAAGTLTAVLAAVAMGASSGGAASAGGETGEAAPWRAALAVPATAALLCLALTVLCLPESPRWLAHAGALRGAEDVVSALRAPRAAAAEAAELAALSAAAQRPPPHLAQQQALLPHLAPPPLPHALGQLARGAALQALQAVAAAGIVRAPSSLCVCVCASSAHTLLTDAVTCASPRRWAPPAPPASRPRLQR
jgi:MFS family permease